MRCNYSATNGSTGLILPTQAGNLSYGSSQASTMPRISVIAGQTFALIIDNYSANTNGYTLTFGGTAQIIDNVSPTISGTNYNCSGNTVSLNFSEPVRCSEINTSGNQFSITGPLGNIPVTSLIGNGCSTGSFLINTSTLTFNSTGLISGVYTVTTTGGISDKCGNSMATQSFTFQYFEPITIAASNAIICAGSTTTLTASVANTFTWSTNAGSANTSVVSVNPIVANVYSVTGINSNGCAKSATIQITVDQIPTISVTNPPTYCPNQIVLSPAIITNPAKGVSVDYSVSNANIGMPISGSGIPISYTAPPNTTSNDLIGILSYTPILNGCPGQVITETITIKPTPFLQSITSQYLCSGVNSSLVNFATLPTSINSVFTWSYSIGGTPTTGTVNPFPGFLTSNSGTTIAVTAITVTPILNGCVGSDSTFNVSVYPETLVSYTLTQNAAPQTWDAYPTYPSNATSVIWDWGDGTPTTSSFYPSHIYASAGRYNICVLVTYANGCTASACQNDTVYRFANYNDAKSNMVYINILNPDYAIENSKG